MDVNNNQSNLIKESLNKEKGISPSIITESKLDLHKILLKTTCLSPIALYWLGANHKNSN